MISEAIQAETNRAAEFERNGRSIGILADIPRRCSFDSFGGFLSEPIHGLSQTFTKRH